MENTLRMSTSLSVLLPYATITMKQQLEKKERE
jgi:hypothetical protein